LPPKAKTEGLTPPQVEIGVTPSLFVAAKAKIEGLTPLQVEIGVTPSIFAYRGNEDGRPDPREIGVTPSVFVVVKTKIEGLTPIRSLTEDRRPDPDQGAEGLTPAKSRDWGHTFAFRLL
jgi:hypothetical protein